MLPVVVDAMGGDDAPGSVVEGAHRAAAELERPIVLVGRPDELGDTGALGVIAASEVIAMDAEPGSSVRRMKDSSLVRAAEAVRDGKAVAMVSAGNTGATMASALLRMGRIKGVARPAIAVPIPCPFGKPTILLDAGANAECQPGWLVQFAQMGATLARRRFGIDRPAVGVLSIGEESGKGTGLVRDTHELLARPEALAAAGARFIGNVEGRDLLRPDVDVVVTDGFAGNVALKSLEGALAGILGVIDEAFDVDDERRAAAAVIRPVLGPLLDRLHPDQAGGAALLGVRGVCVVAHGSSSPTAVANAISLADQLAADDLVAHLRAAVTLGNSSSG